MDNLLKNICIYLVIPKSLRATALVNEWLAEGRGMTLRLKRPEALFACTYIPCSPGLERQVRMLFITLKDTWVLHWICLFMRKNSSWVHLRIHANDFAAYKFIRALTFTGSELLFLCWTHLGRYHPIISYVAKQHCLYPGIANVHGWRWLATENKKIRWFIPFNV